MVSGWTLGFDGRVDVNNGFVPGGPFSSSIPADKAFIAGGEFSHIAGTITIEDADGTLQFDAQYSQPASSVFSNSSLINNGLVIFNANATIGPFAHFTMPTGSSSITVNAGRVVNIDDANFNADGSGQAANVLTIHGGAILDLDLGVDGDESLKPHDRTERRGTRRDHRQQFLVNHSGSQRGRQYWPLANRR